MAHLVLTDTDVLVDGYDWSGDTNSVAMEYTSDEVDDTNFESGGTRERLGGLLDVSTNVEGAWEGTLDPLIFNAVGVADGILTVTPEARAAGGRGFMVRNLTGSYQPLSGAVGERASFSVSLMGSTGPLVRGTVLEPGLTNRTTSSNSSGQQVGAVTSGQSVYASLHVLTASGTSLDVTVESDDNAGFTSATTRLTFTTVTTSTGGQWQSAAGPITDDYWRAVWTLGAAGPYLFVVTLGIR